MAFASVAGGPIPIDPYSLSPTIMKNYSIKTFMYDSKISFSMICSYVLRKQSSMSSLLVRLAWQHICTLFRKGWLPVQVQVQCRLPLQLQCIPHALCARHVESCYPSGTLQALEARAC